LFRILKDRLNNFDLDGKQVNESKHHFSYANRDKKITPLASKMTSPGNYSHSAFPRSLSLGDEFMGEVKGE
jgi:hypothetical protein